MKNIIEEMVATKNIRKCFTFGKHFKIFEGFQLMNLSFVDFDVCHGPDKVRVGNWKWSLVRLRFVS